MTNILVTGASGFIATNLILKLLQENNTVIGLSRDWRKNKINGKNNYQFYPHDVRNSFPYHPVRVVYHLASPSSISHFKNDPIGVMDTIILGTQQAIEFASQSKAKFIFISSLGALSIDHLSERSCYDEAKRVMETYVFHYAKNKKLNAKIIRLPSVYGQGMKVYQDRLISNFMRAIISNKPIPYHGNIDKKRTFAYIDDVVNDLIGALHDTSSDIIKDITLTQEYTVRELGETLKKAYYNGDYSMRGIQKTMRYFQQCILEK